MRTYSLYLNTKSTNTFLKPTNKTNLNSVSFNVDWATLFPTSANATRLLNTNSKCKLKAHLISAASTGITWANQKGTLRINGLATTSQNPVNGVILGYVYPVVSPIVSTDWYLECDTTQSIGVEISIPTNPNITVSLFNDSGNAMTNSLEYELILHFEFEDDDTESVFINAKKL
jgi:hypothetical protein